jgi:hypothetical protein
MENPLMRTTSRFRKSKIQKAFPQVWGCPAEQGGGWALIRFFHSWGVGGAQPPPASYFFYRIGKYPTSATSFWPSSLRIQSTNSLMAPVGRLFVYIYRYRVMG